MNNRVWLAVACTITLSLAAALLPLAFNATAAPGQGAPPDKSKSAAGGPARQSNGTNVSDQKPAGSNQNSQGAMFKLRLEIKEVRNAGYGMKAVGDAADLAKRTATRIVLELRRPKFIVPNDAVIDGPIMVPEHLPPGLPPAAEVVAARPKWLEIYVDELDKRLELLQLEAGRAELPQEKQAEIAPLNTAMLAQIKSAQGLCAKMPALLANNKVQRQKIYDAATGVIKSLDTVNNLRKQIFRVSSSILNSPVFSDENGST